MPQLNVGGTKISIDDGFLKLSPQEQDDFVKNTIIPSPEFQAAQKNSAAAPPEPEKPRNWSDVPLEAVQNIPSSAYNTAAGVASLVGKGAEKSRPFAALGPLAGVAGGLATGIDVAKAIYNDPDLLKRIPAAAWKGLVDRYGGEEAIKKTIATDPVGFALDVGTLYAGGEGVASRVARGVSEIGNAADVSRPFYDLPRGEPPPPAAPPPVPSEVQAAIQSQPRALTTDNRFLQQAGQTLAKTPLVGENLGRAIEAVPARFGEARDATADQLGNYRTPQNIGGDISQHIGGAAEAETAAAEAAARQADEAAQGRFDRATMARDQAIDQQEQRSAEAAQRQLGDVAPDEMGNTVIDTVRANHEIARNAKDAAYRDAGNIDATVLDEANANAHQSVLSDLRSDRGGQGTVDMSAAAVKTSRGMLRRLRQFSEDARNRVANAQQEAIDGGGTAADAAATGQSMRRIEQLRQDLNFHASGAENDADRRAASRIISALDDWHGRAVENNLMEGSDPNALPAMQRARALNRDYRERFGYNDRNDADTILNKIVQPGNQIGPDDVSKALFANGNKPARLLDAIYGATGDHPNHGNVVQAIRGGVWNRLATGGEGERGRTVEAIAGGIHKFMNNREVAGRVFSEQDQALARSHANTLRGAVQARNEAAAYAKANRPVPTEVEKGPMQELADRVLGNGQKPAEAVFDTIEGYAKSKGGGKDIATLAKVMNSIPPELQGNFRSTFIRRLGTGVKGDFSPAVFAKEWGQNINPHAKKVLFGDSGHVRSLDELAEASKRFDEVSRRFGNVSGSGHTVNFSKVAHAGLGALAATLAGSLGGPLSLAGGWFGSRQFANFLATPAGAASAHRFVRAAQRLQDAPTVANAVAAKMTMRNMGNTAAALRIPHSIPTEK
jgi:hypothetical protein